MSESYRLETDLLGERQVPAEALHGIHTERALENFPLTGRRVNPALIHAYGAVKLACVRTNEELGYLDVTPPFRGGQGGGAVDGTATAFSPPAPLPRPMRPGSGEGSEATASYPPAPSLKGGGETAAAALAQACHEMMEGLLDEHVVVDALQGGAGTSTNMNVNEVLANRALQIMGLPLGSYEVISPLDHVNLHQSTNDTYPTALKIAAIYLLRDLERAVVQLLEEFQRKERATAGVVKVGRTQLQDAVLTTVGREMSAYAEAFGRDRWRIYKCEERLRVVNLGGTAIGTGLAAPRRYIFRVIEHLRSITNLGLARAENMVEATQNTDVFVEVSGILKACASNLLKVASDIRLLSSGPDAGFGDIRIPARQAGSSIMPGKVNPVIPEAVSQAAMQVMANDQVICMACSMGNLELNAFLPIIADALLGSLDLLRRACDIFTRFCVVGIEPNEARTRQQVAGATATVTALVERIGYHRAQEVAERASAEGKAVREVVEEMGLMAGEEFDELTSPEMVTRLGSPEGEGVG